jgi:hypothetical protein
LLGIVSIDQRITDFQSDLNMTTRTSAYLNFHPTLTADYAALKDGTTITSIFPLPDGSGTAYSLTVTSETDSAAVLVTVSGGPTSFGSTHYLQLNMSTTGIADYRIVTLEISTSTTFTGTPQIK